MSPLSIGDCEWILQIYGDLGGEDEFAEQVEREELKRAKLKDVLLTLRNEHTEITTEINRLVQKTIIPGDARRATEMEVNRIFEKYMGSPEPDTQVVYHMEKKAVRLRVVNKELAEVAWDLRRRVDTHQLNQHQHDPTTEPQSSGSKPHG
ncbi:hypothetical protein EX30DRAFT_167255 [Ascodesmis nigricans]|uniref:Uncharacterized protein n=1 Tax=Ascodesmis nigricans TaxID=341454 RepID=A0A4S2MM41_9PEZI|nr:hypothetical protein EX30DRAFT_167255 [Ascodesmis nigricans]